PEALRYQEPMLNGNGLHVRGSQEDLRIAVSNVLDNAVKYSGDHVDVQVRLEAADAKRVTLHVQDQGVGIPPEDLKRIFRRFYRITQRSLTQVKGTGLGLFIVKSIAKKHGGTAFALSEGEGHGTTVVIELPKLESYGSEAKAGAAGWSSKTRCISPRACALILKRKDTLPRSSETANQRLPSCSSAGSRLIWSCSTSCCREKMASR